jgi:CubicO group peptidase (beta-lactamase class C family)
VSGLLVIKDGQIAREIYQYGNNRQTCWMSMSMAKSITSTLIGSAVKEGYIKSIDDPVTAYVASLKGSAYEGVSIRNVLMMSSGVAWDETYTDQNSDRRQLLEAQIAQRPGALLQLMAKLPRAAPPGTVNTYSTGETQIAGEVLYAAIKRPLSDYLSERIWKPAGMQSDASWWLSAPNSVEVAGSGISATLRDYGRFGLFILNNGRIGAREILPEGWVQEAGSRKQLKDGKPLDYGYFWWPIGPTKSSPDPRDVFSAIGIFGQFLYINPGEQLVIVVWSARSKPSGMNIIDDVDFFDAVAKTLH